MNKKILFFTILLLNLIALVKTQSVFAASPTLCAHGGYCMYETGSGSCPTTEGTITVDEDSCSSTNNTVGYACCYLGPTPTPTATTSTSCGTPQDDGSCKDDAGNTIPSATTCQRNSTVCCATAAACEDVFPIENIIDGPSNDFFDALNPLKTEGDPVIGEQLSTPGGIVSRILQFLFPLAGLILFVMIIWGGFEILTKSTQGSKAIEAGKNRITAAIVGFLLLFATYWMAQIIETIFGIVIV